MERSQRPVWLGVDRRGWDHVRVHLQLLKDNRLDAYDLAVYLGIAAHAEVASGRAFPAKLTLAKYAQMSERKVFDCIRKLQRLEYLHVEPHPGEASAYILLPPPDLGDGAPSQPVPAATELRLVDPGDDRGDGALGFDAFWDVYPRRNGRKLGKAKARAKWAKLPLPDRRLAMQAVAAYADAVKDQSTIAKDAERFLSADYWRDWADTALPVDRPPQQTGAKHHGIPLRGCDACDGGFVEIDGGAVRRCPVCNTPGGVGSPRS